MELPNWFEAVKENFEAYLLPLDGKELDLLQLGAYTGDTSVWLIENLMSNSNSKLIDVDIWEMTDQLNYRNIQWPQVEMVYDSKVKSNEKVTKFKGTTNSFFKQNSKQFDFIYIDADHEASSVLTDAVNSWLCLKVQGIMAFDDYAWDQGRGTLMNPKIAIDSFLEVYSREIEVICENWQVWVRKISNKSYAS
jgi:predicted O-methyltransferase YrrM